MEPKSFFQVLVEEGIIAPKWAEFLKAFWQKHKLSTINEGQISELVQVFKRINMNTKNKLNFGTLDKANRDVFVKFACALSAKMEEVDVESPTEPQKTIMILRVTLEHLQLWNQKTGP